VQSKKGQAKVLISRRPIVTAALFKSNQTTPVTRKERMEECSVCHNYALQYEQFKDRIGKIGSPTPQVRCGACHNAHIPGPNGNQLLTVDTTVNVTLAGTTVTAVTPVTDPRNVSYRNLKPYRINDTGAQDFGPNGIWTRGSLVSRPNIVIVSGVGALSESNPGSGSDRLFYAGGGFLGNVHHGDTIFISAQASATATLPGDAVDAGASVTVRATLGSQAGLPEERKAAGFEVENVIDNNTLAIKPAVTANATVTYTRTTPPGGTGSLSVPVPISGLVNFQVRDMKTNSENLCGSCHTQGKYKFTAWGKRSDNPDPNSREDFSSTHNKSIIAQYLVSGHANAASPPFAEFSAFEYGSSHQPVYPFDMSLTGSGTRRSKGNTSFALVNNPPASAGLGRVGNNSQFVLINNYACNQCHHGLGSIDYQKDRQGTEEAQVLWGDSTVTCVTCHDPHKDQNRMGKNVRIPVKLSYNSRFVDAAKNPRGGINKFMDGTDLKYMNGTDLPLGNGQLCLFCHQGRESGLTVYKAILAARPAPADPNFPYTNPNELIRGTGISFVNPHYLDSGALLWGRNAWEYIFPGDPPQTQTYSEGIPTHQELNCTGCHMSTANATNTEGGHTWKPQVETCKQCHVQVPEITKFSDIRPFTPVDYDGDGFFGTVFEEIGTITPGAPPDGSTGTGLFGQLVAALKAQGILYNPDVYPYFNSSTDPFPSFTAWTTNTLSAAFNLSWTYKSGACVYYHNSKYVVQILHDSLRALGAPPPAAAFRPPGPRPATDYRTIVVNP
jgi:hypothetical protein